MEELSEIEIIEKSIVRKNIPHNEKGRDILIDDLMQDISDAKAFVPDIISTGYSVNLDKSGEGIRGYVFIQKKNELPVYCVFEV